MLGIILDKSKEKMVRSILYWKAWLVGERFSFVSLSLPLPCWVRYIQVRHRGDQLAMTGRGVPTGIAKHLNLLDMILLASEGEQLAQVYELKI